MQHDLQPPTLTLSVPTCLLSMHHCTAPLALLPSPTSLTCSQPSPTACPLYPSAALKSSPPLPAAPVAHPQALQKAVKQMANKAGTEGLVHGIKNPELRQVGLLPDRP